MTTVDKNDIIYSVNVLDKSTFSLKDTSALDAPFYNATHDENFNINDIKNNITECTKIINTNKIILDINKKLNLPTKLLYIYCLLDSLYREFTYSQFIFMSFNEIKQRYDLYVENNQKKICDIAFTYMGMGHIVVVAYNIINNKFFFRYDGGANGWERDANWKFIKDFDPETRTSNMYTFEEIMNLIEKTEDFYNIRHNCIN